MSSVVTDVEPLSTFSAGLGHDLAAVVDVGSNSVRLVVFEGPSRGRLPIFNEKVLCGLGRSLNDTGRLDEKGVERAVLTLKRFAALIRRMGVAQIDSVATAAVRDAADGNAFVQRVRREVGLELRVLSGKEEAIMSGYGVLASLPRVEGLVGDLGGGSLELVELKNGRVGNTATLPLGPLRLQGIADATDLRRHVDQSLEGVEWLPTMRGQPLYVVGGGWRSLARVHMAQTNYPLHIIDNYTVEPTVIREISRLLSRQSRGSLQRLAGVSSRRVDTLPHAAFALRRLLKIAAPDRVVFCAHGLREGLLYDRLTPTEKKRDPLLESCRAMAERENRFAIVDQELFDWMSPVFEGETKDEARLRSVACLLSDVGWRVHPDYRDQQAFRRVLRAPFPAIDHAGRGLVALAVLWRYRGNHDEGLVTAVKRLLTEQQIERAQKIGLALRLAHTLTGGTPGALGDASLTVGDDRLTLTLGPTVTDLSGEIVQRRLDALAKAMGRIGEIDLL
ncbi:MAG: Ppx/GppA family phosphatase [Minwuiales bacterium]|nr:Ppx/GppA family phosphatase [Minwuiales bacterium]